MQFAPQKPWQIEAIIGLLLLLPRLYLLDQAPLADYDAATNWLTVTQMARGDWSGLLTHNSPGLFLLLLPVYLLWPSAFALEAAVAAMGVAAVLVYGRFFWPYLSEGWRYGCLLLLMGSSTFLVASSRYLSIEMPSLVAMGLLLHALIRNQRSLMLFWLLVGFSINYKMISVIPILILIDGLKSTKSFPFLFYGKMMMQMLAVLLIFSVAGYFTQNHFLFSLKFYVNQIILKAANPDLEVSFLQLDLFFYLKFIFLFENKLLFLGWSILMINLFYLKIRYKNNFDFQKYLDKPHNILLIVGLCFFLGMSLLAKAPRGLLFAYPLLFGASWLSVLRLRQMQGLIIGFVILALAVQGQLLHQHIYQYAQTAYPQVRHELAQHEVRRLFTTVGQGIRPYLPADMEVVTLHAVEEWQNRAPAAGDWLLIDGGWQVAQMGRFDQLSGLDTVAAWREPHLLSPMLYLENCEFNGRTFAEALAAQKQIAQRPYQLWLTRSAE